MRHARARAMDAPRRVDGMTREADADADATYGDALALAHKVRPKTLASDFSGCHRCRAGRGAQRHGACGVVCAMCPVCVHNCACGEECTDAVWFWCGLPIPLLSCVTFSACYEDGDGGTFVARDKQRNKACVLVPLYGSSGGYAVYAARCDWSSCSTKMRREDEPCCVAEPMFRSRGPAR